MNINIEKALLEGGLVFVGIFLALILENYFDENELRAKQHRLLEELTADLEETISDIENDIRILESQGYMNLQGGKTQDDGKFAYLDTKEKEGPILEIAQLSEAGLGFFDVMHEASKNWDKKTQVMDLGEVRL